MTETPLPGEVPLGVPVLREASVPYELTGAVARRALIDATPDAVLLRVPLVGRFLVRAEGPALVERAAGATDADLGCFRDGPVAAAAALLRGDLALRAACISIGGRAVALCGVTAAGKSALAADLAERGHASLADAVTVVSLGAEPAIVRPVAPELRLWPDSARKLGLACSAGRRVRPALAQRAYRLGPAPAPAPLAAVVTLQMDATVHEPALELVSGAARVQSLISARWHGHLALRLGVAVGQFQDMARLAAAVHCVRIVRPPRGSGTAVLAGLVEDLVQ